uniref:PAT1 homolog 2 n=1 Tax=Mastacembelus armatus TaxID=205130 RepID=A0A7N8XQ47_9TELE
MTVKEKEWITRLQMIQLQSENPYLEDYYYQEYYRRIEAKMAEEELGIRSRKEPPKLTTPYIMKTESYTPVVHIEGSLGQVAVSTCYSPRRAIGAVHAVQEQKDTRQQRLEVLSKLEKLFVALLEVEETEPPPPPRHSCFNQLLWYSFNNMVVFILSNEFSQTFLSRDSGGDFLPFLLVSKGKKLLARLIPFLKHDSALTILHTVSFNLPTLMSRDTEEVVGLCLVLNVISVDMMYLDFFYYCLSFRTDTIFQVAGQLSQCSLVEPLLLPSNLLTLFCRYLDKRTVHQLKSNME